MISVSHAFVTEFHRHLATKEWLKDFARFLAQTVAHLGEYQSTDGDAVIRSRYNEGRFMGPLSLCKYWFHVDVRVKRLRRFSKPDRLSAEVEFDPNERTFRMRHHTVDTKEIRARDSRNHRVVQKMIRRIKASCPIEEVENRSCPWCGAPVVVSFHYSGDIFAIGCAVDGTHFCRHDRVRPTSRPPWWESKISYEWLDCGI